VVAVRAGGHPIGVDASNRAFCMSSRQSGDATRVRLARPPDQVRSAPHRHSGADRQIAGRPIFIPLRTETGAVLSAMRPTVFARMRRRGSGVRVFLRARGARLRRSKDYPLAYGRRAHPAHRIGPIAREIEQHRGTKEHIRTLRHHSRIARIAPNLHLFESLSPQTADTELPFAAAKDTTFHHTRPRPARQDHPSSVAPSSVPGIVFLFDRFDR